MVQPATTTPNVRPRRTRKRAALLALVLLAGVVLGACMNPQQQETFDLVNASRARAGLPALTIDLEAQNKAQAWAEQMARENRLYHSNLADGMTGWRMLAENVGYGSSIAQVHEAYMNSSGHKANILNNRVTHIGTGVARGNGRTWTVHVFVQR